MKSLQIQEKRKTSVIKETDLSVLSERLDRSNERNSAKQTIESMSANKQETILLWAFEHSSNGKLITDLDGVITAVNDAFVTLFGYSKEEVIGERTSLLRSKYSTKEFYQEMWKSLNATGEWKGEIINRAKNGDEKTCFLTITSIISPEGERLGYFGVEIDLTERKQLEEQVIQGEKLASIGESLATLMHEIRNPINGIAMNVYMLAESAEHGENWSDEERESIHLIRKEVSRLDSLIKNALSYARKVELNPDRVLLPEFLHDLRELVIYQAEEKQVELILDEASGEQLGYFDENLMKQVMLNLLQNAIEAASTSDRPAVRLRVTIEEAPKWRFISESARVLYFAVENSGERISDAVRLNLFKPFFTTKGHGLGLGLATSAKIVRQHHGIIAHEHSHTVPYTTMFTVALPI